MKHKAIRLPASDLTTMGNRFGSEWSGRSEFIRTTVEGYMTDKNKVVKAVSGLITGTKTPVDQGPRKRTSVFLEPQVLSDLEGTAKRLGLSLDAFIGLVIHDALEETA